MTTTNLGLDKPVVGADDDAWGGKLDTDLDLIDAVFNAAGDGTSVGLNVGTGKTLDATGGTAKFTDARFTIYDEADATKLLKFQLGNIATGTTRTLTIPDANTIIVGADATQTLTNKTITAPDINGGTADALTSLGIRSTGTGAFDLTLANTENLTAGHTLTIKVNDGARTLDLGGNLTVSGASALTLTTTGATNVTLPTTGTLAALGGTNTWSATQTFTVAPVFTDASGSRTALGLGTAATKNTGTSGATVPLLNAANTWSTTQTFTVAPTFTDTSGSRTALGLGTASTQNTGTSGANVPLLNGANTWSTTQTFTVAPAFTDASGTRKALGIVPVPPAVTGKYLPPDGYSFTNGSSSAIVANTLYLLRITTPVSIDALAVEVAGSAASGNFRVGLYNASATTGGPTTLIEDAGTASTGTTGIKVVTLSQTRVLAGTYWLAFICDSNAAGATFRVGGPSSSILDGIFGSAQLSSSDAVRSLSSSHTYGSLPATITSDTFAPNGGSPMVAVRAA